MSVPDYLVVIQIEKFIVISLVLHALEIHPVPQNPCSGREEKERHRDD